MKLQALSKDPSLRVSLLGATRKVADCEAGLKLNAASGYNISFTCLDERHFVPEVREILHISPSSHQSVRAAGLLLINRHYKGRGELETETKLWKTKFLSVETTADWNNTPI